MRGYFVMKKMAKILLVLPTTVVLTSVIPSITAHTGGLLNQRDPLTSVNRNIADMIERHESDILQEELFDMILNNHYLIKDFENRIQDLEAREESSRNSDGNEGSNGKNKQKLSESSDPNTNCESTGLNDTKSLVNNCNLNENSHESFVKSFPNALNITKTEEVFKDNEGGIYETECLNCQDDIMKLDKTEGTIEESVRNRSKTEETTHADRLFKYLFDGYRKNIRPIDLHTQMLIEFELSMLNIIEMDIRFRTLRLHCELIMKWMDRYLKWDPKDFNGVSVVRAPSNYIWTPDIILINAADSNYKEAMMNTFVIIEHTGKVTLLTHAFVTSVCDVDVQYYPFDQQTCVLKFSSWTYDSTKIKIISGTTSLSYYTENPEFFLEDFWSTIGDEHNVCCPLPFSIIRFYVQLQRHTKFALFFYMIPGILINLCAVMVFAMPAESKEKINLGINALTAMVVFLVAMKDNIPPTQKLPLAGVYYGVRLFITTANVTLTVTLMNVHFRGKRGFIVPPWLKIFSLFLANVVRIGIPQLILEQWDVDGSVDEDAVMKLPPTFRKLSPIIVENGQVVKFNLKEDAVALNQPLRDPFQRRAVKALEGILKIIKSQEVERLEKRKAQIRFEEWKFVSRVFDRLLFIILVATAVLVNVVMLTSSPYSMFFEFCPYGHNNKRCNNLTELQRRDLTSELVQNDHHNVLEDHLARVGPALSI